MLVDQPDIYLTLYELDGAYKLCVNANPDRRTVPFITYDKPNIIVSSVEAIETILFGRNTAEALPSGVADFEISGISLWPPNSDGTCEAPEPPECLPPNVSPAPTFSTSDLDPGSVIAVIDETRKADSACFSIQVSVALDSGGGGTFCHDPKIENDDPPPPGPPVRGMVQYKSARQ